MNMHVEPTDIVEFYPKKFYAVGAARSEPWEHNKVVVKGRQFTRTIFRPYFGPDILYQQYVAPEKTYRHLVNLKSIALGSEDNFRQLIIDREPQGNVRFQPPSLNHQWSWHNVAEAVVDYAVLELGLNGIFYDDKRDSDILMVWGEEARGSLYIVNEHTGWGGSDKIVDIDIDALEDCALCEKNYIFESAATDPIRDLVRFNCLHVFHRNCLLPFLWSRSSRSNYFQCPSCSNVI